MFNFARNLDCLFIVTILSLWIVTGCTTGQRAQSILPPEEALNQIEIESNPHIEKSEEMIPNEWWSLFQDPQLTEFLEIAFAKNPTLQAALTNIMYAKANAGLVKSSLYPQIFFGADVSRQKLSETGIIPFNKNTSGMASALNADSQPGAKTTIPGLLPGAGLATPTPGGADGIPVFFTQYETEIALTYEFDIWGKNRKKWLAAIGEIKSKIADTAFIRLELGIAITQAYYRIQTNYRRKVLAKQLVQNKEQKIQFIKDRIKGNLDPIQALEQTKIELASAQQYLLNIEKALAIDEYQLKAYLANDFLENVAEKPIEELPLPKIPFPNDLPLHLISQRPDIIAQIWLIEAADNLIDVAKIGFYPDFNLFALFGYQTLHLHKLFNWKSSYFNVDPAVTLPIFDGGRLMANLRESEVNYDLEIFQYNQLVINAAQEVLTSLTVLKNNQEQLESFKEQVNQQERIFDLTQLRIRHHLDSGLNYLAQEETLLYARDQELTALGNTIQSILLLIKALGGGYDPCYI